MCYRCTFARVAHVDLLHSLLILHACTADTACIHCWHCMHSVHLLHVFSALHAHTACVHYPTHVLYFGLTLIYSCVTRKSSQSFIWRVRIDQVSHTRESQSHASFTHTRVSHALESTHMPGRLRHSVTLALVRVVHQYECRGDGMTYECGGDGMTYECGGDGMAQAPNPREKRTQSKWPHTI